MARRLPKATLFPYTTLFRSRVGLRRARRKPGTAGEVPMGPAAQRLDRGLGARPSGRQADQPGRSEEHTSELQSPCNLVCPLHLAKKNIKLITPRKEVKSRN